MNAVSSELDLRNAVIATAREMNAQSINRGTSGNVSARWRTAEYDGYLVTPTGMPYAEIGAADIVIMPLDGDVDLKRNSRLPSSEWRFHRDIYAARPDATAIVHTHSPFATSLACLHRHIPPFHYMVAVAGGKDIRCAPYATFGTQALSDGAVAALEGRRACLLANHGMIVLGDSLAKCLALAVEVETLAEMYWRALQVGDPVLLSDAEMEIVIGKFRTYGQRTGATLSESA